jgi:protein involved in sex pheromone biosynthesis
MARLLTYGVASWTIPAVMGAALILSGCSRFQPEPEIKVVTKVEQVQIPTVTRPKPAQLSDTRVFVVTKDNFEEFEKEFTEIYGELAFVALSMKDYENLALNIAELRRFLNQQKEVIVYYEKAVTKPTEE